jgi:hypothetical protein
MSPEEKQQMLDAFTAMLNEEGAVATATIVQPALVSKRGGITKSDPSGKKFMCVIVGTEENDFTLEVQNFFARTVGAPIKDLETPTAQ